MMNGLGLPWLELVFFNVLINMSLRFYVIKLRGPLVHKATISDNLKLHPSE